MVVRVHTYNHPKEWRKHTAYDSIKKEIHICATSNMAEGIKEQYMDDEKKEFQYVFTIHQLVRKLMAKWHKPEHLLEQYLTLSKTINDIPGVPTMKTAFKNNASEVLDTIRFLAFSGVIPESMPVTYNLTDKEKFFFKLWRVLEKNNREVYEYVRSFTVNKWDRDKIIRRLNWLHAAETENKSTEIDETKNIIVLHGFYFITPEQQVILKFLERSGFELIFFQFYDDRFPKTFDFVKGFISRKFGWPDDWDIQTRNKSVNDTQGARFLQCFEDGVQDQQRRLSGDKVNSYDSFFNFLHEVIMKHYPIGEEKYDVNAEIVATNADILNEMLIQYYPERFSKQRNFLNYPVGQFILKLHEMRKGNRLILNNEILMTIFSSGWLTDKKTNENARHYAYDLEQLLPFFSNCTDIEDWLERMNQLLEMYDSILLLFNNGENNRVLESVRSPFSKIAHFSLDKERVIQIRSFFVLLEQMAKTLFDLSKEETSIDRHFNRLSELMKANSPIANNVLLQKQERDLINILHHKIEEIEGEHSFLYEDIGEAVKFYLSGRFSEDEDPFIKPFIEVDGEAFKKEKRKVYVTGLDEQGLPLGEFDLPWPLQQETFNSLGSKHQSLQLHLLRNNSVKKISRYLLFIVLEFSADAQLELSWIRNFLDREDLEPSVYARYLNMNIDDKANEPDVEEHRGDKTDYNKFDFTVLEPDSDLLDFAIEEMKYEDILAEYRLCPRRFYYGMVLGRFPVFSDEFLHQFIFSEIIKLVKRTTQHDDDSIIEMVSEVFPQWTKYHKENMAKNTLSYRTGKETSSMIGGVQVSDSRKHFQFPGLKNDNRDKLYMQVEIKKEEIMHKILNPDEDFTEMLSAKPGYNCRYCPFLDYCKSGQYAID